MVFFVLSLMVVAIYYRWPLDGITAIYALLLSEQDTTVYAPSYSDQKFRHIEIGMQRSEVYQLLGPPLRSTSSGLAGNLWAEWSYSPQDADYRRREIVFQNDIVIQKISEYWLD